MKLSTKARYLILSQLWLAFAVAAEPAADERLPLPPKRERASKVLTGVLAVGGIALLRQGDPETVERVGDATQIAAPIAALTLGLVEDDPRGVEQYVKSFGMTSSMVTMLKARVEKPRPDRSNGDSFPSGHTAAAFSAAGFVQRRYGSRWGAPMMALAGYTGLSRVAADKHYLDDVISGASIGLLSSWYATTRRDAPYRLEPQVGDGSYGFQLSVDRRRGRVGPAPATEGPETVPRFRYAWEFGYAELRSADSTPLRGDAGATVTARVDFRYRPGGRSRHETGVRIAPFELRDGGSIYAVHQYGGYYRYAFRPDRPLSIHAGVAIERQHVSLEGEEGERVARAWLPLAEVEIRRRISSRIEAHAGLGLGARGSAGTRELSTGARFELARGWQLGLGWRRIELEGEAGGSPIRHSRNQAATAISYTF